MTLGSGMDAVIFFAELVDRGIQGSLYVEKGWYCNRSVKLAGKDLREFIKKEYPGVTIEKLNKLEDEVIYTVVADDFS